MLNYGIEVGQCIRLDALRAIIQIPNYGEQSGLHFGEFPKNYSEIDFSMEKVECQLNLN
jgi:hypothetical protein